MLVLLVKKFYFAFWEVEQILTEKTNKSELKYFLSDLIFKLVDKAIFLPGIECANKITMN